MPDTTEHECSFDHLIHIVDDLTTAMASYDNLGLPTHAALSMPGFRNAAWGIDDARYVELAVIDDWDAASGSVYGETLSVMRPTIEASATPGLVSFAVHVPDAHATAESLRDSGYEVSVCDIRFDDQVDGQDAGFTEVFVTDAPAWFPFFISYSPPREVIAQMRAHHRVTQGGDSEPASVHGPDLVALLVHSTSPSHDARLLADLLGCELRGATVALPGADIHVERMSAPDSAPGLYGFTVQRAELTESPALIAGAAVTPATTRR
ncbi:MAG: VOC family protein [Corynebacterium sp.]|uniref:VOC family protein n=1 Tax=Corynebacterium sp. TaxID=1720 RepID=UPI003F1086B0